MTQAKKGKTIAVHVGKSINGYWCLEEDAVKGISRDSTKQLLQNGGKPGGYTQV